MVEQFRKPEWLERTPNVGGRIVRAALADLLVLACALVACELGLRAFAPGVSHLIFNAEFTGGHPKAANSQGLRDDEIPLRRPDGELRILALGNSTTWGTGVDRHDVYANQLERMLGDQVQVVNAGGEGGTIAKALRFMNGPGVEYGASTVILGFSPSMVAKTADAQSASGAQPGGRGAQLKRWGTNTVLNTQGALYSYYTFALWDHEVRKGLYRAGILKDRMDKQSGAIFAYGFDVPGVSRADAEAAYAPMLEQLGELSALLRERRVNLLVLGIPSRFEISELAVDHERGYELGRITVDPLDRVKARCQELGLGFVDLRPRLRAERAAMVSGARAWDDLYTFDLTHLDEEGHRLAAEELREALHGAGWDRSPPGAAPMPPSGG